MYQRIVRAAYAGGRTLVFTLLGMLALGIGVGASSGLSDVLAGDAQGSQIHACVNRVTGAMRYVSDPGRCTNHERVVSWYGSGSSNLTFTVRTSIKDVPANASGTASNSASCEPGETAVDGGSRTLYEGTQVFASWVKFDLGGGPADDSSTGWVEGYSYSNSLPNTAVETWVLCVS